MFGGYEQGTWGGGGWDSVGSLIGSAGQLQALMRWLTSQSGQGAFEPEVSAAPWATLTEQTGYTPPPQVTNYTFEGAQVNNPPTQFPEQPDWAGIFKDLAGQFQGGGGEEEPLPQPPAPTSQGQYSRVDPRTGKTWYTDDPNAGAYEGAPSHVGNMGGSGMGGYYGRPNTTTAKIPNVQDMWAKQNQNQSTSGGARMPNVNDMWMR